MKRTKLFRRIGVLVLTALVLAGTPAAGAADVSAVTAELRPYVTIVVDGVERSFYTAQGKEVHTIFYNGAHYLPVRAIGELMGRNVNWNQSALTITLAGERTAGAVQGTPDAAAQTQSISVQLRPDFTLVVDGVRRTFTTAQGSPIYPMLHNGTTYLPLRAIGELMGKSVGWNAQTAVITLSTPAQGSLVTDADSFNESGARPQPDGTQTTPSDRAESYIGEEMAKAIALEAAGVTASQAERMRCRLERDDGRWEYSVEFIAGALEYEYEIDAYTGAVLSRDIDSIYD